MEHSVDGMLASDVFNLSATENEGCGECGGIGGGEFGFHLLPNKAAHRGIGFVKPYFVKEAALEGGVEIVEQHVHLLQKVVAIKPRTRGQLIGFVAFERLDNGLINVERIFVVDIAVTNQATAYEGIHIGSITEHTDVAQVKVAGEVIVVHSTRSALHADAKQHRLLFCDAVAISNQSDLERGVLQEVLN